MEFKFPVMQDITIDKVDGYINTPSFTVERKYDGVAALMEIKDGVMTLTGKNETKNGRTDYTSVFPEIQIHNIDDIPNCSILGEIVYLNKEGWDDFQIIQKRANRKNNILEYAKKYPCIFIGFDLIEDEKGILDVETYYIRKLLMYELFTYFESTPSIRMIGSIAITLNESKKGMYNAMIKNNWEGLVFKNVDGVIGFGQVKYKPVITQDVFCEGEYREGKGRHKGKVGSLKCYQILDGEKQHIGYVGCGDDTSRDEITAFIKTGNVDKGSPLVLEIKVTAFLPSGKFRFPRFLRIRDDKKSTDCIRFLKPKTQPKSTLEKWA